MRIRYILLLLIALGTALYFSQKGITPQPEAKPAIAVEKPAEAKPAPAPAAEAPAEEPRTQTPAPYEISCKYLSEALAKCEPYTCEMPHPTEEGFVVKHTIAGQLPNGLCVHVQTAPDDMTVVCNYSPEMRILVAKNMRTENKEKLSQEESNVLSAGFEAECEVVNTKTGEVVQHSISGELEDKVPEEDKEKDDGAAAGHLP